MYTHVYTSVQCTCRDKHTHTRTCMHAWNTPIMATCLLTMMNTLENTTSNMFKYLTQEHTEIDLKNNPPIDDCFSFRLVSQPIWSTTQWLVFIIITVSHILEGFCCCCLCSSSCPPVEEFSPPSPGSVKNELNVGLRRVLLRREREFCDIAAKSPTESFLLWLYWRSRTTSYMSGS